MKNDKNYNKHLLIKLNNCIYFKSLYIQNDILIVAQCFSIFNKYQEYRELITNTTSFHKRIISKECLIDIWQCATGFLVSLYHNKWEQSGCSRAVTDEIADVVYAYWYKLLINECDSQTHACGNTAWSTKTINRNNKHFTFSLIFIALLKFRLLPT